MRKVVQMVFQDPDSALNPRRTVQKLVTQVLEIRDDISQAERNRIAEARFGIPQDMKEKAICHLPDEMQDVLKQFAGKCEIKPK